MEKEQAKFTEEMESRIHDILEEFHTMELTEMRKGEIEARARLAKAKKTFEQKRDAMRRTLAKARKASEGAWDEARDGLEAAWGELRESVDRARAQFDGVEYAEESAEELQKA